MWSLFNFSFFYAAPPCFGHSLSRGGGEIFRTRPDRPWGPPSLLYSRYRSLSREIKWPGRGVDHPPPSSAEVKERVELHLYCTSGLSWSVLGWTLPLPVPLDFRYWVRTCSGRFEAPSQICEKQLLASSCLSVRMEQLGSHWTDFLLKLDLWVFFKTLSRKCKFH